MDGLVPLTGEADAKHTDDDAATMRLRYRRYSFLALLTVTRREEVVARPPRPGAGRPGPSRELTQGHYRTPQTHRRTGEGRAARRRTTSRPYPF